MGSSCTKAAPQEKGPQLPSVGDVMLFPYGNDAVGTITEVMKGGTVKFQSPGPSGKIHEEKWERAVKVDTIPELNELLIVDGKMSGAVTVNFRGEDCKGWIVKYVLNDNPAICTFVVQLRPDDDHKAFDDTDFDMGESESVASVQRDKKITKGHTAGAAERPRVRTAEEIEETKVRLIKVHCAVGYKMNMIGYLHCGGCGRGVWESPCDCFPTQKRKGYFCQACAKEYDSGDVVCCETQLNKQPQSVGWAKILKEKYGPLK